MKTSPSFQFFITPETRPDPSMPADDDVLKKSGCLCGIMNLFKRHVSTVNKHHHEEEEMEKNTDEAEKWKDLWLKQREEIKSLLNDSDSSMMMSSRRLHDHLLDEFASLKVTLQSIAHDVAQLKADQTLLYSRRVNDDHTHFTSLPMSSTSSYDRGVVANKSRLFDDQDDYYTSCHYANSHHHPDEDEEYGGSTTATGIYPPH